MREDGPVHSDGPAILSSADGSSLQVPDGFDIFTAEFGRDGDNLLVAAEGSPQLTVIDYFAASPAPALVAPNGSMLTGGVVELLAGPRAPGQYAQAGDQQTATPIGQVETLSGTSSATRLSGETIELGQGDPVYQGDVIQTGSDSNLGIRLEDGTLASLSSQSRLVLNEFVYEADGSDNWMVVDLVEGAFAFLTGAIAPSGGMEITTPVAVMAIRGTMPIAIVAQDGASQFFAGSDKQYELLHLTTKELIAVISSGTGYALGSPDATLQTIDIDPETLDEINNLLDVLNDTAASLGFLGIQTASGFSAYSPFGSIDNLGPLMQFLQLLEGALAEEAVLDVEDSEQFLMAEATLVASPDQAVTGEMSPVLVDVLDNDSDPEGDELTVVFADVPNGQGSVTIVNGKSVLYDPGTAFDYLALGETSDVVITYAITDPSGAIASSTVTVTLTGINQAPVIEAGGETGIDEQTDVQPLQTTISVAFTDVDLNNIGHEAAITGVAVTGADSGLTLDDAALIALLTPGAVTKNAGENSGSAEFAFSVDSTVFDYLAAGDSITLTYTVEIDDQDGGTTSQTFDVVITGTNDGPVVSDDAVAAVEDGPAVAGSFLGEDVDSDDDAASLEYTVTSQPAKGTVINNGDGTFSFDPGNDFQRLAAGETRQVTFSYTATDSHGAVSEPATVTVTVTGTNDAPVIVAQTTDASATVNELADTSGSNFQHVADGTISFADVDLSDTHTASAAADGQNYLGSFVIGAVDQAGNTLGWSFTVTDADLDGLGRNTTLTQTYTVTIDDGHGGTVEQVVTITINGTNDAPVIVIGDGDSASADLEEQNGGLQADGTLTVGDVSVKDVVTAEVTAVVASGDHNGVVDNATLLQFLTVSSPVLGSSTATGTLTWAFDSNGEAFDFLADGEDLVLTYTVVVDDGLATSSQTVTITIAGTNDLPVVSVSDGDSATAGLDETNSGLEANGTLSVGDLDISNVVTAEVTQVTATGDQSTQVTNATLLGFLTVATPVIGSSATAGTLNWTFDSGSQAFDFLADGEELVLTYTVQVDDGSGGTDTQAVTVTITGTNDAPRIVGASTDASGSVTELANTTGSTADRVDGGTITFADADLSDTHSASFSANDDGYIGNFTLGAVNQNANTVGWTFTVEDGALDHLAAGETLTQSYTVIVSDGNGGTVQQVVNVTITGTNDAPTTQDVSGLSGFVGDAIEITLSGSDVDGTVNAFKITTPPSGGGLFLDANGQTPVDPNNIPASGNEATIYFIPGRDTKGDVSFEYAAVDDRGAQDQTPATVDLTVDTATIYLMISQDTWQGGADLPTFDGFQVTVAGVTYDLTDLTVVDSNFYGQNGTDGFTLGVGIGSGNKERYVVFEIDGVPGGASADISFDYKVTDPQGDTTHDGIRFYAGTSQTDLDLVLDADNNPAFTGNDKNVEFSPRVLSFNYALIAGVLAVDNVELTAPLDPIVLDLGEPGLDLSGTASFDLDADAHLETLAWTGGEDAILAMDLDGSGAIESGNEVFSPFFNGGGFADALDALASLDANGDNVIDGKDEAFADLLAWVDANSDGESQPDELVPLAELGVTSFDLDADGVDYMVDGQRIIAEGQFTKSDGSTGDYAAVALEEVLASPEPQVAHGGSGGSIDEAGKLFAVNDLSIHDVIVDYHEGDVVELTQLGFAMATGQLSPDTASVDGGGSGDVANFKLVAEFESPPPSVLVRLTDGDSIANIEIA